MKKTMIILLCVLGVFASAHTISASEEKSELDMYKEMIYATLSQDIDNAVNAYYANYLIEPPNLDLFSYTFTAIKRIGNHEYEITVEVQPFVGAHNSIGRDRITFKISPFEKTSVIRFEHVESMEPPEHLKYKIKNPLS